MKLHWYRPGTKLLQVLTGVNTDQTGPIYRLAPGSDASDVINVKVFVTQNASGGASTPTHQVVIESSTDGVAWVTAITGTSRAADGTIYTEYLDGADLFLGPYIRAKLALGGGTKPTATCKVELISDRPLQVLSA